MSPQPRISLAADLLAIDVGNSKIEAVLVQDGSERFRWRLPYTSRQAQWQRSCAKALQLAWRDMHPRTPIVMASVAPRRDAVVERLLRQVRAPSIHRVSWRDPWPFRFALEHPETVGADRLANVAGLVALGLHDGIAVDVGTAVTIDVLRRRRFLGGLILPGAALMARALQSHTAQLPLVDWRGQAPWIGDSTASAIRAGIVHGLTQAVAGVVRTLMARLDARAQAVVTGGQSSHFATAIPALRDEPDLLFLGLRLLAARQRSRRRTTGGATRPRSGKKARRLPGPRRA
jgi:type III pantothenate kinase